MQTFLPFADFERSAKVLDKLRLGKQRLEAWQILCVLTENKRAWANHPCTKMWRGFVPCLALYGITICDEWIRRGCRDIMRSRFEPYLQGNTLSPIWLGYEPMHYAHRSRLVQKKESHYLPLFAGDPSCDFDATISKNHPNIFPLHILGDFE